MELLLKNHLIYDNIYSNLSIKKLCELYNIEEFRESIMDHLRLRTEKKFNTEWILASSVAEELHIDIIKKFWKYIYLSWVLERRVFTEEEFEEIMDNECVDWYSLHTDTFQNLSTKFLRKYKDVINWRALSIHRTFKESELEEFSEDICWGAISKYQNLSENFMRKNKEKLSWKKISKHQKLREDFISEFREYVSWENISKFQKLSKDFILRFRDHVVWSYIFIFQKSRQQFKRSVVIHGVEYDDDGFWEHNSGHYRRRDDGVFEQCSFYYKYFLNDDGDNFTI